MSVYGFDLTRYADVWRTFQYDYIYCDLALLLLWLGLLISLREYKALVLGIIIAPLIFGIDAGIWWHSTLSGDPAIGLYLREYWIGGVYVPHDGGALALRKFGADFMMTVSYAMFAFPWLWIGFRSITQRKYRRVAALSVVWVACWLSLPLLSQIIPIDDTPVRTVRHMSDVYRGWIIATLLGYALVLYVYRKDLRVVALLFLQGAIGALIMEIPLHLSGIRPFDPGFVLFEAAILLNQAVPFLFVLYDKLLRRRLKNIVETPSEKHR